MVIAGAALGALVVVGVVALVLIRGDNSEFECADTGLEGPLRMTPEEAVDAFAEQHGGQGSDWEPIGDGDFKPRNAAERLGLQSIGVSEIRPATWQVTGGCVGS